MFQFFVKCLPSLNEEIYLIRIDAMIKSLYEDAKMWYDANETTLHK